MSYDEIYSKLKNVGQEQLLDFYDELNDEEKENLLKQIEKIDFSILDLINHQNEEKKKGVITPLKGGYQTGKSCSTFTCRRSGYKIRFR